MSKLEICNGFYCFLASRPVGFNHVGRKINRLGSMVRHVGASLMIFGQLGGIIGQPVIIMAPLWSSLGLLGEKVAVAQATATFSKATVPLNRGEFEMGGSRRG